MKVGGYRSFFLNGKENRRPLQPAIIKALLPSADEGPKIDDKKKKDEPGSPRSAAALIREPEGAPPLDPCEPSRPFDQNRLCIFHDCRSPRAENRVVQQEDRGSGGFCDDFWAADIGARGIVWTRINIKRKSQSTDRHGLQKEQLGGSARGGF